MAIGLMCTGKICGKPAMLEASAYSHHAHHHFCQIIAMMRHFAYSELL
jgi:hypothetical protein